jgi:Raf kinase inhibitor-like YbhB/YbcL family protein
VEKMELHCSDFEHEEMMPQQHGRSFDNKVPSFSWEHVPENTKSFALVCHDPDALSGTWIHWVVYNIPSDLRSLPNDLGRAVEAANGVCQGLNSWGEVGYDGPQPPSGSGIHRYFFTLYALNTSFDFKGEVPLHVLTEAMKGHVLSQAEYMGRFGK